jgi:ubiquitin-protein ligase E3 D
VPLSAFIVEDMNEFVQAHATYRFVILDEEEERPRILVRALHPKLLKVFLYINIKSRQIWLFKPNIKLAYTVPAQHALLKSGSIHAAKVLFKIVGPPATREDLGR